MAGSRTSSGSGEPRRDRFGFKILTRVFHRPSDDSSLRYHFYILGPEGEILRGIDRRLADDEAAMRHAQTLLPGAEAVEVLRGALVIGRLRRHAA
jgi:hypothetical protein